MSDCISPQIEARDLFAFPAIERIRSTGKPVLGIDLDNVVFRTADKMKEIWDRKNPDKPLPPVCEMETYRLERGYGVPRTFVYSVVNEESLDVFPHAVETLSNLNNVVFVTGRTGPAINKALEILHSFGINFPVISARSGQKWKVPVDLFIEDDPDELLMFEAKKRPYLIFSRKWNEKIRGERVRCWKELAFILIG